ncbi:hypothetical protein JCM9534A_66580 [Catenuloplanes indicus JCM 9534]
MRRFARSWLTAAGDVPASSARQATDDSPRISAHRTLTPVGAAAAGAAVAAGAAARGPVAAEELPAALAIAVREAEGRNARSRSLAA